MQIKTIFNKFVLLLLVFINVSTSIHSSKIHSRSSDKQITKFEKIRIKIKNFYKENPILTWTILTLAATGIIYGIDKYGFEEKGKKQIKKLLIRIFKLNKSLRQKTSLPKEKAPTTSPTTSFNEQKAASAEEEEENFLQNINDPFDAWTSSDASSPTTSPTTRLNEQKTSSAEEEEKFLQNINDPFDAWTSSDASSPTTPPTTRLNKQKNSSAEEEEEKKKILFLQKFFIFLTISAIFNIRSKKFG